MIVPADTHSSIDLESLALNSLRERWCFQRPWGWLDPQRRLQHFREGDLASFGDERTALNGGDSGRLVVSGLGGGRRGGEGCGGGGLGCKGSGRDGL